MARSLKPCPDSPNCVSTLATDPSKRMPPLRYSASAEEARKTLLNVLQRSPRARIVEVEDVYVHAEFTTLLFRFVDDVEFLIDPVAKLVHFRSASRVGHSDLGTNRRRMSDLSRRLGALGFTTAR